MEGMSPQLKAYLERARSTGGMSQDSLEPSWNMENESRNTPWQMMGITEEEYYSKYMNPNPQVEYGKPKQNLLDMYGMESNPWDNQYKDPSNRLLDPYNGGNLPGQTVPADSMNTNLNLQAQQTSGMGGGMFDALGGGQTVEPRGYGAGNYYGPIPHEDL